MFSSAAVRKRAASTPAASAPKKQKLRAIVGDVQAGKTAAILRDIAATPNLCLVIVRNVGPDVRQFMNACNRAGMPAITLSSDRKVQSLGCCALEAPRVVVLLANSINVRKAVKLLDAVRSPPFTLFVDEADKIAFSTEPSERSFRAELERLQARATEQVLVTATMFNFMTLPEVGGALRAADVDVLTPSDAYCGIRDIRFGDHTIDGATEDPAASCYIPEAEIGCDHPSQPRAPESLERWLRGLRTAERPPGHPVFALARMGNKLDTIFEIARAARRVDLRILPVVYTGDGVAVPTRFLEYMEDRGRPLAAKRYKKLATFSLLDLPLQQFLSAVKDSRLLGDDCPLLVCAGVLAARGVNFADSTYSWALTHEYFLPAASTNVTELQQAMRVLGNKPWPLSDFRPVLTTKHSVMRNIAVGADVQTRAIDALRSGGKSLRAATAEVEVDERPTVRYAANMVIGSVKTAL